MATNGKGLGTALVTGASGGIGLELARELGAHGYDLVLAARSAGKLAAAAAEISARSGVRAEALPADLARPGGGAALARALAERGVEVAALVNDAGVGMAGPFAEADPAALEGMVQLNVAALTGLTRALLPAMVARRQGRVLNVASTAGFVPGPNMAVYYATKAYVVSLSVALAEELAGSGVTVTALCPGPTRTGFGEQAGMTGWRLFSLSTMGAAAVARAGVAGMLAGRTLVVPGVFNKAVHLSAALSTRRLAAKVAAALNRPAGRAP